MVCNVSILMSVYNETEKELKEAIESMLAQTYKYFELIIVNDNPCREDLKVILNTYSQHDNRVRIINNERNIGLAMSLNKAASLAKTDIFVRMDADDISHPDRIEIQYNALLRGYDFIFTRYSYIDENSDKMNDSETNLSYYEPNDILRILPIKNIIHHPTVMMTKEIFEKAGRYRDFPCAQDYDLWLRIYEKGGRFIMIDKPLLQYRIRKNSISKRKKYQQKVTLDYTRRLFKQRILTGKDMYSREDYHKYLKHCEIDNPKRIESMYYYDNILKRAKQMHYERNYIGCFVLRLKVFIGSADFRRSYIRKNIDKILFKKVISDRIKDDL